MSETPESLEGKLLEILRQEDINEQIKATAQAIADDEVDKLDDRQRATLNALLEAGLPSPDQIVRSARSAEHNARVQVERDADLARRRERRAKCGTVGKKHRRR